MARKSYISAAVLLLAAVALLGGCVLEYDFERAPPWARGTELASATNVSGTARGWGGNITVTLDLVAGNIENVRIVAPRETPSHTATLLRQAPRNAEIFNTFDFLDGMTGATVTRNAIRDAGETALMNAGVDL